jgi:hypothetical protein
MLALIPQSWCPVDLGRSMLRLCALDGTVLELDLADGGGYTRTLAIWRVRGRAVLVAGA